MASTYSTSLRLELMATGDQSGTWGTTTNTNLGTLLEQAITGYLSVAQGDVANLTLTSLNGTSDQARNMVLNITGALTAARNVVVPTVAKIYLAINSTTGGFAVTFKTAAGTGVSVAAGESRWVYCDATSVVTGLLGFYTAGATTVATAATMVLDSTTGILIDTSGATTVTAVTLAAGAIRFVRAGSNFQITVGTSLIGNGYARDVQVKAGDLLIFEGYTGGVVRFWLTRLAGTAITVWDPRNREVNSGKTLSLENAQTSGTTTGRYLSDQNAMYFVTSAGTITGVNVQTVSPAGGYRDRVTITVADASLAAGEYLTYTQNLEGSNVLDFQWGTASAVQIVRRFGFKGPAGTYAARFGNSAANRSYVALFTITAPQANTDTVQTIVVPGDTSGTWLTTDGVIGVTMDIVLACGSTFQGTTGWQAGNILGTSGVSNGMATGGAVFEIFDCGVRLDPDATGSYGLYEVGEVHPVYRAERYWENGVFAFETATAGNFVSTVSMIRKSRNNSVVQITNIAAPSSGTQSVLGTDFIAFFPKNAGSSGGIFWNATWTAKARLP